MVDVLASAADAGGVTTGVDGNTVLLLAIRGYTGQLSPSSSDYTSFSGNASTHASATTNAAANVNPSATPGGGVASKIAADPWYEQSRTLVMNRLRSGGSSLESVLTLLFCALRDQGKGTESQAWLLLGMLDMVCPPSGLVLGRNVN